MEVSMASVEWRAYRHQTTGYIGRWADWLIILANRVLLWQELARERRHLHSLDDHMLKDMGLSRSDVEREAARPFWDADGLDLRRLGSKA